MDRLGVLLVPLDGVGALMNRLGVLVVPLDGGVDWLNVLMPGLYLSDLLGESLTGVLDELNDFDFSFLFGGLIVSVSVFGFNGRMISSGSVSGSVISIG